MTHVLLGGERKAIEMIRAFLAEWGVTCGLLGQDRDPAQVPLLECDVVILGCGPTVAGESGDAIGAWEMNPESCGSAPESISEVAPVLVVGNPSGRQHGPAKVWSVVSELGPQGKDLRLALEACCVQAGELRSRLHDMHLFNDYAQFLGHELRSPLTAVKTALEVLEGDLGGMVGGDPEAASADMRLKMVEIALRNVRRLHRTVEWSQDLLEMSESSPQVRCRRLGLEDLLLGLDVEIPVEIGDHTGKIFLRTDPDLLAKLLDQLIRVMEFFQPDQELLLRFHTGQGQLTMNLSSTGTPNLTADQDSKLTNARTHLLDPDQGSGEAQALELTRLAEFMISGSLLEALGASLIAVTSRQQEKALILSVPLCDDGALDPESRSEEPDLVYSGACD